MKLDEGSTTDLQFTIIKLRGDGLKCFRVCAVEMKLLGD